MGFLDLFFKKDDAGPSLRKWKDLVDLEKLIPMGTSFLENVAIAAKVDEAVVVAKPDGHIELRGKVRGYLLRIVLLSSSSVQSFEMKYDADLPFIDLTYDPEVEKTPPRAKLAAWEPSDTQHDVGPGVFIKGSSADQEHADFRKLPVDLQARVVETMRRLRIRYFRTRRDYHDNTTWDDARDFDDPVAWMAGIIALTADVAAARGAKPYGSVPKKEKKKSSGKLGREGSQALAQSISAKIPGSKVVERKNDDAFDVRWSSSGLPTRIIVDVDWNVVEVAVKVDGAKGAFTLVFNPEVVIEDVAKGGDEWDEIEETIFFGKSVFVCGGGALAKDEAAVLRAVPPAIVAEVAQAMDEDLSNIDLDEEVITAKVIRASDVADGGARAIAVAEILARLGAALPRGGAKAEALAAVRCKYCRALGFPSPERPACVNCGAAI